jgi:hypothetical protein
MHTVLIMKQQPVARAHQQAAAGANDEVAQVLP